MIEPSYGIHKLGTPDNDRTIAAVTGEVDNTNVTAFTAAVAGLPGPRPVVLDISELYYLDSAGFAALDGLLAAGTITAVLAPDSRLHKAAALIGLPHFDSTDAALA